MDKDTNIKVTSIDKVTKFKGVNKLSRTEQRMDNTQM